jgi:hypothetical protein
MVKFTQASSSKWFPAVEADVGTSMSLNSGERAFAHKPPCGYVPLHDLTVSGAGSSGPLTAACWTCKGECAAWDESGGSCAAFTYPERARFDEVYGRLGMLPGGIAEWTG